MINFTKQAQPSQAMEDLKSLLPQLSFNKNGYELRTKILELAQSTVWKDYCAKWGQFETTITRQGDEVVTKVVMPQVPGADQVLEAAEKFYRFVNNSKSTK